MMNSPDLSRVLTGILKAIREQKIILRDDQNIRVNVGLREDFFNLMLSYEPYRLQLVLEAITRSAESDPTERDTKKMLAHQILHSEDIRAIHCKSGVILTPSAEQKYQQALDIHLLEKFFTAVILLDRLRLQMLCGDQLQLFRRSSLVKSTSDVLVYFCKKFLKSEGNILKRLSALGAAPRYLQSDYDEFDFTLASFQDDLRDGIRLTYLVNNLSRTASQGEMVDPSFLRIPAVSRLQKVHNVSLLLQALLARGVRFPFDEKCIVDGHRESLVFLLSLLLFEFESQFFLSVDSIQREICRIGGTESTQTAPQQQRNLAKVHFPELELSLLTWVRVIASKSNFEVKDLTTDFGLGLCLLIRYYRPDLIQSGDLFTIETLEKTVPVKRSSIERKRFAAIHQACQQLQFPSLVPSLDALQLWDEKAIVFFFSFFFLSCIDRQSLPLEATPAPVITVALGDKKKVRCALTSMKPKRAEASIGRQVTEKGENSPRPVFHIETDQALSRMHQLMQSESRSRLMAEQKVAALESCHAESLRMAEEREEMLKKRLNEERSEKMRMKMQYETDLSDEIIRSAELALWQEYQGVRLRNAVILVQRSFRRTNSCRLWKRKFESIKRLQALARSWIVRRQLVRFKSAVLSIQKAFWSRKRRQEHSSLELSSVLRIQSQYRIYHFVCQWKSFVRKMETIKLFLVQWIRRREDQHRNRAAIVLQGWTRRCLFAILQYTRSESASSIQRLFRAFVLRKAAKMHLSASKIQTRWKEFMIRSSLMSSVCQAKRIEEYRQRRAASAIVKCFHAFVRRKKERSAARAISRWYLSVLPILRIRKLLRGMRRLQSVRRSLLIRRRMPIEIAKVYQRIKKANETSEKNPQLRLGNQTNEAISILLKGKMISQVLRACQTLELSTQYSTVCCHRFVKSAASKNLFSLICSCNRSTPHQELLRFALFPSTLIVV
jgi:abnormal spindle-like microcephaly-associated protein